MKLLPYYEYKLIKEINYGYSVPFSCDNEIKNDGLYNYIEFEYINDIGEIKIVSIDFIILDYKDIVLSDNLNRNINDYLYQFNQKIDKCFFIFFFERLKGVDRMDRTNLEIDKNVKNSSTKLFQKMSTIINIFKYLKSEYNIDWFVFQSIENDPSFGKIKQHNKRNKFYDTYLSYYNVKNYFIKFKFIANYKDNIDVFENFYAINI